VERSGAVSGSCRKRWSRAEHGAGSGDYRNRLERRAAFFAAHAPLTCSGYNEVYLAAIKYVK